MTINSQKKTSISKSSLIMSSHQDEPINMSLFWQILSGIRAKEKKYLDCVHSNFLLRRKMHILSIVIMLKQSVSCNAKQTCWKGLDFNKNILIIAYKYQVSISSFFLNHVDPQLHKNMCVSSLQIFENTYIFLFTWSLTIFLILFW